MAVVLTQNLASNKVVMESAHVSWIYDVIQGKDFFAKSRKPWPGQLVQIVCDVDMREMLVAIEMDEIG
jgi:hypothetical protein